MEIFRGSGVAIVTPFNDDKKVDYNCFEKLINFQLENDTDAIIVCGTTGEASTLTEDEHIEVVKFCVDKVAGKIPVISGAGGNDTSKVIKIAKKCQNAGVDGILSVTPYYNRTNQRGLIEHFSKIANSIDTRIILYNVPSRTTVNIEPKTVQKLAEIENIVGVKEASGNIAQVAQIVNLTRKYKDFAIYSGNDNQILPLLSLGGVGVISVCANIIPKTIHDIVDSYLKGDIKTAKDLQIDILNLSDILFCDVNPIPVKHALALINYCKEVVREPLINMEKEEVLKLEKVLKDYKLM